MKKYILLTIVCFLLSFNSFSQKIEPGRYVLVENGNSYYVTISNDSFCLFKPNTSDLIQSPENRQLIDRIGVGTYVLSRKSLDLYFDSTKQIITDYTTDSIQFSFSTDVQSKMVSFIVNLKFGVKENGNNALIISSYKKDFFYPIKNQSFTVDFPDSIPIKAVKLGVMGYDHRVLPYDHRYNNFTYNYYFNDDKNRISLIIGEKWNFSISNKKPKNNILLRLGNNGYLRKVEEKDIEFLSRISVENPLLSDLIKYPK